MTVDKSLLLEDDARYLSGKQYRYSEEGMGGWVHVIVEDFALPCAYTPRTCRLLIRIPPGYPNANPDMFWTQPDIRLASGAVPQATECHETYNGQSWQRWSRHIPQGCWRPGTDNLQTFLRMIRLELEKGR